MKTLAGLFVIALYLIIGAAGYVFLNDSPVEIVYEIRSVKPVYKRGEPIQIYWRYQKKRDCKGQITRYVIDENGLPTTLALPGTASAVITDGEARLVLEFHFPEVLPAGLYTYELFAEWSCYGGLRTIRQDYPPPELPPVTFAVVD